MKTYLYPKKSQDGFMITYVIVMTLVIALFILSAIQVIDTNRLYLSYNDSKGDSAERSNNDASIAFKMDKSLNSNGDNKDILSCSGGVIHCQEGIDPACSTTWAQISDGIADTCNNDNYQGSYSTGNVSNLLSIDSKTGDDDDLVRRRSMGLILPMRTKQVFTMNTDIKQAILLNTNNTGPSILPSTTNSLTLDGSFSSTGMAITLYQLDRNAYDTNKTVSVLRTFSGVVNTLSGTFMDSGTFSQTGTPFAFNIGLYDFVIMVDNQTNTIISYDIGATSLGKSVYILPLNDAVSPKTLLVPDYRYYDGEFIYRSQVVKE